MSDLPTFAVSDIIETIGAQYGLDVTCEGIDDICFGVVITSQQTFVQWLAKHKVIYNFQIIEEPDGGTIRVVRRAVDAGLTVDFIISQADCIVANAPDGSAPQPAIKFSRIDPLSLPREVQIQYVDPDRVFAVNPQDARHQGASIHHGRAALSTDFIIDADTARTLAFDVLFRLWAQQLAATLEHPDRRIEPGDVVQVVAEQGTFVMLVDESTLTGNRTNQLKLTALLTAAGAAIPGGQVDPTSDSSEDTADWIAAA